MCCLSTATDFTPHTRGFSISLWVCGYLVCRFFDSCCDFSGQVMRTEAVVSRFWCTLVIEIQLFCCMKPFLFIIFGFCTESIKKGGVEVAYDQADGSFLHFLLFPLIQRHTTGQRRWSQDPSVQNLITLPQTGPQPQPGSQTWTPERWPLTSREPFWTNAPSCIGRRTTVFLCPRWDVRHRLSVCEDIKSASKTLKALLIKKKASVEEARWMCWCHGRYVNVSVHCLAEYGINDSPEAALSMDPIIPHLLPHWETKRLSANCTQTSLDC